jgi:hypothetical protein
LNGEVTVQPGASLQLFVGGPGAKLTSISSPNAKSFQYYGLPANVSLNYGGNSDFKGIFYAPEAALTMGGGGSTILDFCGTYMVYSANLNGHFNFHFDETLPKLQVYRGYLATSWEEL